VLDEGIDGALRVLLQELNIHVIEGGDGQKFQVIVELLELI